MGMAKTHDVWLYFHRGDAKSAGAEQAALGHLAELFATCQPEHYCATQAYSHQPLTPAIQDGRRVYPDHDKLLSAGLNRERTIRDWFCYFRVAPSDPLGAVGARAAITEGPVHGQTPRRRSDRGRDRGDSESGDTGSKYRRKRWVQRSSH